MNTRATTSRPHREPSRGLWSVLSSAASLTLHAVEFGFYHLLLTTVDRVSRLPRNTTMPEAARLYRENIVLKAQLDALEAELAQRTEPAPTPMATRAAQVFAYLLTRGDEPFQRYFLSAPLRIIRRWAIRFRTLRRRPATGGRPPLDEKVVELILTLKRENRAWGHRRIREELRRMGIRVSEPTIARILKGPASSRTPSRRFLGIWLDAARHLLTTLGGPPVLGSLYVLCIGLGANGPRPATEGSTIRGLVVHGVQSSAGSHAPSPVRGSLSTAVAAPPPKPLPPPLPFGALRKARRERTRAAACPARPSARARPLSERRQRRVAAIG